MIYIQVSAHSAAQGFGFNPTCAQRAICELILPMEVSNFESTARNQRSQSRRADLAVYADAFQKRLISGILILKVSLGGDITGGLHGASQFGYVLRMQKNVVSPLNDWSLVIRYVPGQADGGRGYRNCR